MNKKRKRDRKADLEKAQILNPERIEEKKRARRKKAMICAGVAVLAFGAAMFFSYTAVRAIGKANLMQKVEASGAPVPALETEQVPEEEKEAQQWKEGWVRYRGKTYAYKEDIFTFLIMGIDKDSEVKEMAEGTNGGQADALFLAVMDPGTKELSLIGINRNAMTDVDVYNGEGAYVNTVRAQIAVQHGFGNGMEESCEYQKKAVQKLFYGLPVHGYAAVNMSAVADINDAVGGVEVEVLEDLTKADKNLVKGETVRLSGEAALRYVKYRDTKEFGSADRRLDRQKQYLNALVPAAKQAVKKDIAVVSALYKAVAPRMVTDVTLDEALYLAPELADCQFDGGSLYTLKGETIMGEKFEEFYVDEKALYELILEVFYEEVDLS